MHALVARYFSLDVVRSYLKKIIIIISEEMRGELLENSCQR